MDVDEQREGGDGTWAARLDTPQGRGDAPDSLANLPTPSKASSSAKKKGSSSKKKPASSGKKKRPPSSASKDDEGVSKSPAKKSKSKAAAAELGGGEIDEEEAKRQERLAKRRERDRKLREKKRREAAEAAERSEEEAKSSGGGASANADADNGQEDHESDDDSDDGGDAMKPAAAASANADAVADSGVTHQTPAGTSITLTTAPAPDVGVGWTVRTAERVDSKKKVRRDKTWINPTGRQFKTMKECTVYKDALAENGDDEEEAWGLIREERRLKKKASRDKCAAAAAKDGGGGKGGDSPVKATPKKKAKSKGKGKGQGKAKKADDAEREEEEEESKSAPSTPAAASGETAKSAAPSSKKKTPGSASSKSKPKYVDMIHDAIKALKDRSGSSVPAIQKYLLSQHEHMKNLNPKQLKHGINTGIKSGLKADRFVKVKASYKINTEWVKKEKAAQRAKEAEKRRRQKEQEKKRKIQKEKDDAKRAEQERLRKIELEKERKIQKEEEERRRIENMTAEEKEEFERKKAAELERKRKKEEAERRAKEIADRIKKRRFPMEDFALMAEDRELGVNPPEDVTRRPNLPYVMSAVIPFDSRSGGRTPSAIVSASSCSTLAEGSRGLISDMMQVYHFFRGDVGYGRINADVVPDFTLGNLLYAADEIIKGNAKAARALPPLISHLFVSALRILTGVDQSNHRGMFGDGTQDGDLTSQEVRLREDLIKISASLNVVSWAEICMYYMDAMERFYTTDASADSDVLPGIPIDPDFFKEDEGSDDAEGAPVDLVMDESEDAALPEGYSGYLGESRGALFRAFSKLAKHDPWILTAEELFALLRALTDDIIANDPDLAKDIFDRGEQLYELRKAKRAADINYKRVKLAFEGPKQPPKKKDSEKGKDKEAEDKEKKAEEGGDAVEVKENKEAEEKDVSAATDGKSTETDEKEDTETEKTKPETTKKAEKPSKPLPKATKREFLAAEKAMIKANEAYEKGLRKLTRRTEPIGYDKHWNPVYFFHHDPDRLYIEESKPAPTSNSFDPSLQYPSKSWHVIDSKSLFDDFLSSLDIRGVRENDLYDAVTGGTATVRRYLYDDIKRRNEILARKRELEDLERRLQNAKNACAAEEEGGRRSGRLASLAQVDLLKVQDEIELASAALKGKSAPLEIDYRDLTGLSALLEFDSHLSKQVKSKSDQAEEAAPLELCGRLWKGSGALGLVVDDMLELEAQCEELAPWRDENKSRDAWISGLKDTVASWKRGNNLRLGPNNDGDNQDAASSSSNISVSQLLSELKEPLLDLEARVFSITGLAMAVEAADEASQYVAETGEEEDEDRESMAKQRELAELAWKKKIDSLKTIPTKRAGAIRDVLISAITVARKAHLNETLAALRSALQLHRPGAAGAAKAAALEVLRLQGGYEKPDGEDDEDDTVDESEQATELELPVDSKSAETKIESLLCGEAMMLSGCLGGDDNADRVDWKDAVKDCKTISRFAALTQSLVERAENMLAKIQADKVTLQDALAYWDLPAGKRRGKKDKYNSATEIWANARLTQKFVMAKVEGYPWAPARICEAIDASVAKSLEMLSRELISFVGDRHFQVVHKDDDIRPLEFLNSSDEDMVAYDDDVMKNLKESIQMTRRILKGRNSLPSALATPMKKKPSPSFMEEKKLD